VEYTPDLGKGHRTKSPNRTSSRLGSGNRPGLESGGGGEVGKKGGKKIKRQSVFRISDLR